MKKIPLNRISIAIVLFLIPCLLVDCTCKKKRRVRVEVKQKVKEKLLPGRIPWDFPPTGTRSKVGEYVLVPEMSQWKSNLESDNPKSRTYLYCYAKMVKPGVVESEVDYGNLNKSLIPNSLIISIPRLQMVKTGDIVLTWWQTGNEMQRAIVLNGSNSRQPVVRYLDIDLNNSATDDRTGSPLGMATYQLEENSFVRINDEWQPGNKIAVQDSIWGTVVSQIVNIADKKVLALGFAGKLSVYPIEKCKPMPIKPKIMRHQTVKFMDISHLVEGRALYSLDSAGIVYVTNKSYEKKPVSFGYIIGGK